MRWVRLAAFARHFVILPIGLLSGCWESSGAASSSATAASAAAQRKSDAIAKMRAPVEPRTIKVGDNELLVFEVPVSRFGSFVTTQRCYVWRDTTFAVSSMVCPGGSDGTLAPEDTASGDARDDRFGRP